MKKTIRILGGVFIGLSILLGCNTPVSQSTITPDVANQTEVVLNVMTHDSFAVSEEIVQNFEAENHVKIQFLKSGDTGASVNKAILSKDSPLADVFYGVDNTFLSRALEAGIFEAYTSPALESISDEYKLDPQNNVLPVDYGDICINYDKAYFKDKNLAVPQNLADLSKPEYKDLLVVENPATSSPGLGFLLATITKYGEDGYLDYWKSLKENGAVVVNDWETAYYTNFSASSGKGPQPMAVSYGSSPAVEVVYASEPVNEAPTASIVGDGACFRQIEFVGILKGTSQRALAEKFVDFMLSEKFQADMPLQMYVFPVNPQVKLPEVFEKNIQIPESTTSLDYKRIAMNREKWIDAWSEVMLH